MTTALKCPKCGNEFEPTESIREEIQRELRNKMSDWQKQQQSKFDTQLLEEKKRIQLETEAVIRKSISSDYENKLRLLEESNKENQERLQVARQKEIEFLKKEQELKTKEEEIDLSVQQKLQVEREKLSEELRKLEEHKIAAKEQEFIFKIRELEKKNEVTNKLLEEARRKNEQGSTQMQGETGELVLEEMLQNAFPYDLVEEVGKGVEGADCILTVRNAEGVECGKIIYESKRTKGWSNPWIEKLKGDMRRKNANLAVLVSMVYPKGMECFGEKDGVWIASFKEVIHLTKALRNAIINVAEANKTNENRGEKMHMLYQYLTGNEFRQQIEAIVEGFMAMRQSIIKERLQMEKLWKEREKQIEKVLLNTSGMYGSIKGLAGSSVKEIPSLELPKTDETELIDEDTVN